jgi:hypothetical protein
MLMESDTHSSDSSRIESACDPVLFARYSFVFFSVCSCTTLIPPDFFGCGETGLKKGLEYHQQRAEGVPGIEPYEYVQLRCRPRLCTLGIAVDGACPLRCLRADREVLSLAGPIKGLCTNNLRETIYSGLLH